jgi:hypothetical protein
MDVPVHMPLHDRSFDLVLLSNWEDQVIYEQDPTLGHAHGLEHNLTTPANKVLESGAWTQSIIWGPRAPFRDFTQLEFNHEDDVIPEERSGVSRCIGPTRKLILITLKWKPFDLGNDPGQTLASATSSICQMTNSMRYPKKEVVIVCGKHSGNLW